MANLNSSMTLSKPNPSLLRFAGVVVLAVAIAWSFWPTFRELAHKWFNDAGYSHGILVPFFAGYLLWARRGVVTADLEGNIRLAAIFLAPALILRIIGGLLCFTYIDAIALLPCLAGIGALLGGWRVLRWSWPAVAFLFFMIPLPYQAEVALGGPLQRIATLGSAFTLQVLGQPAVADGNTIMLNEIKLGIVEACSGLRMLLTFFAFSTAVAILIRKPWLEKICIILSAVPIALLTNILRITVTGIMYQQNEKFAKVFFHDLAGWFMMPICLLCLGIELWILNRLIWNSVTSNSGLKLAVQPR